MSLDRVFSSNGEQLTIFIGEKFDFSTVADFRTAYSKDTSKVTTLIVDMQSTEYIDSSALGMLLNMQKAMKETVSSFKISFAKPQVLKVLQTARFGKKFDFI